MNQSKKKVIAIICGASVVVLIAVFLICILVLGDKDEKTPQVSQLL